jgi:hypothetical protein
MSQIVGEKGLWRHLDEDFTLRKKGVNYTGALCVDSDERFYVAPISIWRSWGSGDGEVKFANKDARVYINDPGKDIVYLMGKGYRVGAGEREDQFREYRFVSEDPLRYRANRARLEEGTQVITDKGLGNKNNWLGFCAIRKPSGRGGYSEIRAGLLIGDKRDGFGVIWTGEKNLMEIDEWDRVILSHRCNNGVEGKRHYTYRKKSKS